MKILLTAALLAASAATGNVALSAEPAAASFTLPELPYATDALAPVIDSETMTIHHGRHHKTYVDNLNAKVTEFPALKGASIEQVMAKMSSFDTAVRNNGGGHYNHSLFWTVMTAPGKGGKPSEQLRTRIEQDFGSDEAFRKAFADAGTKQFGSGWAWLIVKPDGGLAITATANQDNPLMDVVKERGTPILAIDVWEHAYYLQYQNKRADYIKRWWEVVDWNAVSKRYADAAASKTASGS